MVSKAPGPHRRKSAFETMLCCSKSLSSFWLSAIRVLKELLYVTFSNVECLKMEWNLEMIICLGRQTLRNKGKNKPKKNKGWSRMVNDGHGWSRMVRGGKDGQRWIRLTHMANDKSQEITEASLNQSTQLSLVPCLWVLFPSSSLPCFDWLCRQLHMVRYFVIDVQVKVIRKVLLVVLNRVDYRPSYTDFLELMTILFWISVL